MPPGNRQQQTQVLPGGKQLQPQFKAVLTAAKEKTREGISKQLTQDKVYTLHQQRTGKQQSRQEEPEARKGEE